MTAEEVYELLDKAFVKFEVLEEFDGSRFIRIEVEEEEFE
jgi:hypothetical protein